MYCLWEGFYRLIIIEGGFGALVQEAHITTHPIGYSAVDDGKRNLLS